MNERLVGGVSPLSGAINEPHTTEETTTKATRAAARRVFGMGPGHAREGRETQWERIRLGSTGESSSAREEIAPARRHPQRVGG